MLLDIIPKLPMRDPFKTKDYYVTQLGFELIGDYGDYLLLRKEGIEIHFFEFKDLDGEGGCDDNQRGGGTAPGHIEHHHDRQQCQHQQRNVGSVRGRHLVGEDRRDVDDEQEQLELGDRQALIQRREQQHRRTHRDSAVEPGHPAELGPLQR